MSDEIVKELDDFPGYYISNHGYVYSSLVRGCRNPLDMSKRIPLKKLAPRKTKPFGYCRVCLRRFSTGLREDLYIHRLVAENFIPNPEHKTEINHLDCNPANNHVDNLQWVTSKENKDYAFEFGYMTRNDLGRFCHKNKYKV